MIGRYRGLDGRRRANTWFVDEMVIKHPSSREDMLKLIQSLERVTNAVEATAYRMEMCEQFKIPRILKDDLIKLTDSVILTVQSLGKALHPLPFSTEEVLKCSEEIHKYEEEVDDIRRHLMLDFIRSGTEVNITNFYLLVEIIERLEDIADRCDEAGKLIKLIVASL